MEGLIKELVELNDLAALHKVLIDVEHLLGDAIGCQHPPVFTHQEQPLEWCPEETWILMYT
ncbi:hypothetical protein FQZ97_1159190 [compost metagenome]